MNLTIRVQLDVANAKLALLRKRLGDNWPEAELEQTESLILGNWIKESLRKKKEAEAAEEE